jgi:hypothetical protein
MVSARPNLGRSGAAAQTASTADRHIEKTRGAVERIGVGRRITVFLENGDDLHGTVSRIGKDEFEIAEVDFQRTIIIHYKDARKIRSGYGGINLLTGKRTSPPRWVRIAVPVGVLFVVIGLPIIVLVSARD